jgi:hypothetical protein
MFSATDLNDADSQTNNTVFAQSFLGNDGHLGAEPHLDELRYFPCLAYMPVA